MTTTSSARCVFPAKNRPASRAATRGPRPDDLVLRKIAQAGLSGLSGMINGAPDAAPAPGPARRGPAVASAAGTLPAQDAPDVVALGFSAR